MTVVKVIYLSQTTQVRYKASYVSTNSMQGNNDEMWFLDDDYIMEDEMGEAEEQLVDEGEHDVPFNVADIPQQLVTADAHTQREVHLGLYEQQPASGRDHVMKFKASGVKGMWMSTLNCRASEAAALDNDGWSSSSSGAPHQFSTSSTHLDMLNASASTHGLSGSSIGRFCGFLPRPHMVDASTWFAVLSPSVPMTLMVIAYSPLELDAQALV
ncbi:hypothetical protein EDC04DRAFT_2601910 [Pisolithus marmoratus]|nr:hypothetical protein EDC04DRAFT_2601910 [Pisolithus marmoratus]